MRLGWLVLVLTSSCIRSNSATCSDGRVCPQDTVCISLTVQAVSANQCAPSGATAACNGQADFAACTNNGIAGVCYPITGGHACLPDGCGNGILDADEGEVCDDGNAVSGDGCSDSCKSNETCGNGIVDPVKGEQCDDGNTQSHDGCAQSCGQDEVASWTDRSITAPGARTGVAMAYDASTQQIVMFGGTIGQMSLADTWIMTNGWASSAETGPAARSYAGVTYDSGRHRIVMFGGELDNGLLFPSYPVSFLDDTWEWDGTHWLQAASEDRPHPSARSHHTMAYDPARKRVVLFGGGTAREGGSTVLNETWEWDGTTWTQITSADPTAPTVREDAALGYDPTAGKIVLFGGQDGGVPNAETWTYDGTSWTKLTPPNSATARYGSLMATDPTSHHLLMWGGENAAATNLTELWRWDGRTWTKLGGAGPLATSGMGFATNTATNRAVVFGGTDLAETNATWQWDGTTWTNLPIAIPALRDQGIAYDEQRGRAVVFGGSPSATIDLADIWELDDQQWTHASVTTKPAVRHGEAIAYDGTRHVTVIFGGCVTTGCTPDGLGNTWMWDGTMWRQDTGPQPSDRGAPAMAYDAAHAQLVMFGGADVDNNLLDETWVWNGTWTQLHPPDPQPTARWRHAMAYDRVRGKVVMFGGGDFFGNFFDDTWEWDGTQWTQRTTPIAPLPRAWPAMEWSPDLKKVVMFGGANTINTPFGDTWVLDGTGWTSLPLVNPPEPRIGGSLFPTRTGSGLTLFGGTTARNNGAGLGDTWDLVWSNPAVVDDSCRDDSDSDGDGEIGCADSDCWATCTPACLPGAACDDTQPHCGDGVCNPELETCRSCPSDCTCAAVCGDFVCDPTETAVTCPGDCS